MYLVQRHRAYRHDCFRPQYVARYLVPLSRGSVGLHSVSRGTYGVTSTRGSVAAMGADSNFRLKRQMTPHALFTAVTKNQPASPS